MSGGHAHAGHAHGPARHDRAFAVGIALNLAFVSVEVAAGLWADSLALLADAGHNLSDVLGLALAWGAVWLARKAPTARYTYGWRRSTIVASLANAVLLLVAVGVIGADAVGRFGSPVPPATGIMIVVAGIGIVINGVTAWFFHGGGKGDLNIRGAYLHMVADAAVSAGVVAAAFGIRATGWVWLDPLASLLIAVVILWGTWGLLRESLRLSLDAVPAGVDPAAVTAWLAARPGVSAVHDVHIWAMSTTEVALTAHLCRPGAGLDDAFLHELAHGLEEHFGIAHPTVQVEAGEGPCHQARAGAI